MPASREAPLLQVLDSHSCLPYQTSMSADVKGESCDQSPTTDVMEVLVLVDLDGSGFQWRSQDFG